MIIQYIRLSSMIADQGLSSLSITPLSLMDVNSRHSCINLREKTIVLAHSCCHTLTPSSICQTCRGIGNKLVFSKSVDACWGRPEYVRSLEHVQARLTLSHHHRGKLAIHLISPLGTRSTLLFHRYTVKKTTQRTLQLGP